MSVLQWLFEATISFGSKSIAIREIIGGLLGLSSAILYGWVRWSHHKRLGKDVPAVEPRWTTTKEKLIIIPATIIFFIISMQIFKNLGETGQWLFVDTWIFTGTALATFGMSRGYVEFWLVWVAVDLVGVPFAFSNGYYPTGTLYAIYMPFVIWGFFNWLKISRIEQNK
ncbi:MAG: nicotinamide riboside transporter PnuC [Actinobacteria bacterium]|nr:nicotinamide riboside transporter PnuC [Actinomycetota bacterium]